MAGGRVVAIGGGHGLSRVLAALTLLDVAPVAVVTVADDGGSSGRLRRDLGIIAPGDLRQALVALARNRRLAELFGLRFGRGELEGHAVGNLALVALAERYGGDFVAALDEAARLLDCSGRVLPATTQPVELKAQVSGQQVDGQERVGSSPGRIECVWLEPAEPLACQDAVDALRKADTVVLGPGSLFTSVIATLLVPELADALCENGARIVFVGNLTTQPGETSGFDAAAHIDALLAHVPRLRVDAVLLHEGPVRAVSGEPIAPVLEHPAVEAVIRADVARRDPDGLATWGHDPKRLADVLRSALPLPR